MSDLEMIIADVQTKNQMLQNIMLQKQTLSMQKKEIDNALEEVEKSNDDLYQASGPVLIKKPKEEIKSYLEEKKEDFDLRIKALEKQEKKLTDDIKESQKSLQAMMNQKSRTAG